MDVNSKGPTPPSFAEAVLKGIKAMEERARVWEALNDALARVSTELSKHFDVAMVLYAKRNEIYVELGHVRVASVRKLADVTCNEATGSATIVWGTEPWSTAHGSRGITLDLALAAMLSNPEIASKIAKMAQYGIDMRRGHSGGGGI